jgi:Uma2 family endonuclease
MATIQTTPVPSIRRMTAAEFEALPDMGGFELDDGMLVELNVGNQSSWIGGEIYRQLANFVIEQKLGWAYPQDTAFKCFADDRDRIRKPDAAFVGRGRLPAGYPPLGTCTVVPDLVVEVVSPDDMATELERKVVQYVEAGVKLVWVIYPATRTAHVTRLGGLTSELRVTDSLDGEDVIPGFLLPIRSLFPQPELPAA